MNLRPMGAELCHADRQTDSYVEANCRFSQFCELWKQADKTFFCDDRWKNKTELFVFYWNNLRL
jgi:hypothetical protein